MTDLAAEHLRPALPALLTAHPLLTDLFVKSALVLHGSRSIGIDDPHADTDLWLITDAASAEAFEREAGSRFIEFRASRKGHFNIESHEDFSRRMARCDFHLISELRHAQVISDPHGVAWKLINEARKPMSDDVRRAWFAFHYVDMRGEHRGCDNCINRGDPLGLMIGVSRVIEQAMRAAMVLDREPYRYSKWLGRMAERGPTGALVVPLVREAMALISEGALDEPGPEETHRLTKKLKEIRGVLVDRAIASGIDEPWLRTWWLHIDKAQRGIENVTW